MLTRRRLASLLPIGLAAPGLIRPGMAADATPPTPPGDRLSFTVWRKGSRIGTHEVGFTRSGDDLTVHSHAHFRIGLGPIVMFNYLYQVTEQWRGGVLDGISATTNNNGRHDSCEATRRDEALVVTGSKSGVFTAPPASIAGTHWNRAELAAPIINPENGELMHFTVTPRPPDPPPGGGAPATHEALTGFATLDLWYDSHATWVGLRAVAKDHSIIEYHAA